MASKFYPLTIAAIENETKDCVSVVLQVPPELQQEFNFKAGQSLTLKAVIDGQEYRRSYSICSGTHENEWRVAVKKIPNGVFSHWVHDRLKPGETIEVLPPVGSFHLPDCAVDHRAHYLALAAGSGITPVLSMIKTALHNFPQIQFTLIYGNAYRHSIIFKEQIEALKNQYMDRFTVHYLLSREKTANPVQHGRITPEKLDELKGKLIPYHMIDAFFICGPAEMIFSCRDYLTQQGISPKKIHFELFNAPVQQNTTRSEQQNTDSDPISIVQIRADGIQFSFKLPYNGASLLDAALSEGANLPFACKGGVCATCKAKLLKGTVEMQQNYALEPEELEQGYILTCQSHPTSPEVQVDFDH